MKKQHAVLFALSMAVISFNNFATDAEQTITDSGTVEAYCSPADNVNWVAGNKECLSIVTVNESKTESPRVLVIYLHGDGSKRVHRHDYLKHGISKLDKKDIVHTVLMRPGYFDEKRRKSTGKSDRKAHRGTSYNAHNVKEIAQAIDNLKAFYNPEKTLLVGHSGGAAIAALMMGIYPQTADGAVLASCPCNVQKWVDMARKRAGKGALSPHDYTDSVRADVTITALAGSEDNNTLPVLSEEYVKALTERNINSKYILVENATHNGLVRTEAYYRAVNAMLK